MEYQEVIFKFFGGLALFLYGMTLMSEGLKKIGSESFKRILETLTKTRFTAILVGLAITCAIQSSSATSVMVVGFVNAGLLAFQQGVAVVLGADIGTTITAWIVSALGIGDLELAAFSLPILAVGFLIQFTAKRRKTRMIGQAILGFGLLFLGLGTMSDGVGPIKKSAWVRECFMACERNPILGILAGTVVTMLIQSSSATIAIVQVMASQGILGLDTALQLMLGNNIGTTITAQLAAIGGTKGARVVAMANSLFKVFGTLLFCPLLFTGVLQQAVQLVVHGGAPEAGGINGVIMVQIAVAHSAFNIINTGIFSIFLWPALIKSAKWVVLGRKGSLESEKKDIRYLDPLLLRTPLVALEQCEKELAYMLRLCTKNLKDAFQIFMTSALKEVDEIERTEDTIDGLQTRTTSFLVELSKQELPDEVSARIPELIHCINDAERIGDHAENLVELTELKLNSKLEFSEVAMMSLKGYFELIEKQLEVVQHAVVSRSPEAVSLAMRNEKHIDEQHDFLAKDSVARVEREHCTVLSGIVFFDLLTNLEKVGDHLANIAERVTSTVDE
jgi:phosphate:Na+ symporter